MIDVPVALVEMPLIVIVSLVALNTGTVLHEGLHWAASRWHGIGGSIGFKVRYGLITEGTFNPDIRKHMHDFESMPMHVSRRIAVAPVLLVLPGLALLAAADRVSGELATALVGLFAFGLLASAVPSPEDKANWDKRYRVIDRLEHEVAVRNHALAEGSGQMQSSPDETLRKLREGRLNGRG